MDDLNDSGHVLVSRRDELSPCRLRPARAKTNGRAAADASIPRAVTSCETTEIFQSHRARLFRLAYRMLGSRPEADDLLQEAYLRWHQSATQDIQSPVGFLIALTTRLCLDRLRELKHERGRYVGSWLPEPLVEEESFPSPQTQLELTGDISVALLTLLECLGAEERAAFLLHDVFDYDYPEVAKMVGKSEPTCRQIVHRARARVREARPRFSVAAETRERVLGKFIAAVKTGDREAVMALLAEMSSTSRRPLANGCREGPAQSVSALRAKLRSG
jgi:RNA polymerase sigma-70 factor, ECF subfamily